MGLGTTSPWGILSVSTTTNPVSPFFVIASSTAGTATSTVFIVDRFGNVGVGTTTPFNTFSVLSSASAATAFFRGTTNTRVTIQGASGNVGGGTADPVLRINNSSGVQVAFIREDGLIGSSNLGTLDDQTAMLVDSSTESANYPRGVNLGYQAIVGWGNDQWWSTKDIGISRGEAGKLFVGAGTKGSSVGTLVAGTVGVAAKCPAL
jgi:hypothetical protein